MSASPTIQSEQDRQTVLSLRQAQAAAQRASRLVQIHHTTAQSVGTGVKR